MKNKDLRFEQYQDTDLVRKLQKLAKWLDALPLNLPTAKRTEFDETIFKMKSNEQEVVICDYNNRTNCKESEEPIQVFRESRDPEELDYYWKQWYDKVGNPVKDQYQRNL